jgi:hypothetical protein
MQHSRQQRNASVGFTDAARHAGSMAAASPTEMSTTAVMAIVGGCKGAAQKSCVSTKRRQHLVQAAIPQNISTRTGREEWTVVNVERERL